MLLIALLSLGFMQGPGKVPGEIPVRPQFFRPSTKGPTLSEVAMSVRAEGAGPYVVTLPVPSDYSGQTVVSFRVEASLTAVLKSWSLQRSTDGINDVVKITVAPGNREVHVGYSARVIVPGEEVVRTQRKDFAAWLAPTASVQSKNREIVEVVKKLRAGNPARPEFVRSVVRWVAQQEVKAGPNQASDTKTAISAAAGSRGRANLCAAILRSAGIPARTVAYIPTWAEHMDAKFWLTEYESEDGTWEMVEPTVGLLHPARNSVIVLAIARRAEEAEAFGGQSMAEPTTAIHLIRTFPGPSGARLMIGAYHRSLKVIESALKGQSEWLDDAAFQKALSKGPINLALFLDGRPTMPDHPPGSPPPN